LVATPITRTLPDFTIEMADGMLWNEIGTWPLTTSVSDADADL
jgi:hypothetical protein